jgi:hypothetical protein
VIKGVGILVMIRIGDGAEDTEDERKRRKDGNKRVQFGARFQGPWEVPAVNSSLH